MGQVTNIKAVQKSIRAHRKRMGNGNRTALIRAGLHLLRKSMQVVPIDTSTLKNTGPVVTRCDGFGWDAVMTVGYGTDYAV
jgi:hypothetical protein